MARPPVNDDNAAVIEDLRAKVAALQAALQARDDFIAIAAHELRNPMTPIAGQVDLLIAAVRRGEPSPVLLARLERLEFFVRHYIRRATTLLDISRATAGSIRLDPTTFDLAELIRAIVQGYAPVAERASCSLRLHLIEQVVGTWDRLAMEQILDNLLSNALKFGAGKPIEVALAAEDASIRLSVCDRGPGISIADRARIFGRFEQVIGQRQHGGFGIGLWLVRRLVDAMGGEITVASEAGHGATFIVILPRHMAATIDTEVEPA